MKTLRPAVILTLTFIVLTGLLFPMAIYGTAQAVFPHQANGSLIVRNGVAVGSELIGQGFNSPKYFHPRPSAAGGGYDANNSGGTNLGPNSPKLLEGDKDFDGVKQLAEKYRAENGLSPNEIIPVDAVTRSGSGLDPHISPKNAELQIPRVVKARGVPEDQVRKLVMQSTEPPFLGIFGDSRVNVLKLNLMLDETR